MAGAVVHQPSTPLGDGGRVSRGMGMGEDGQYCAGGVCVGDVGGMLLSFSASAGIWRRMATAEKEMRRWRVRIGSQEMHLRALLGLRRRLAQSGHIAVLDGFSSNVEWLSGSMAIF